MELTFESSWIGFNFRTHRRYDICAERYLPPQIVVKVGQYVWSTNKGFRKLTDEA